MNEEAQKSFYKQNDKGLVLSILVKPNASVNKVEGVHDGQLKIRLNAPPVEGAANEMCRKFLGKLLGVPKTGIEIIAGQQSRQKRLQLYVDSSKAAEIAVMLQQYI